MENTNQFLGTERVGKLMRRYAVPCIISLLVGALYNIVDQIFIANASYLGSYGNAANTVVFPLTVVALAIAVMIGDGCCAFVSISLGKGEVGEARKSVGSAVVLSIASSLVLTALYLGFADPIISMFGGTVNEETFHYAREYFFYISLGIPFYMFGQAMNPVIRADGNPRFAMISTLAGAVLNIILDPIFIFECKRGMMGAAVATVLGQIVTAALAVWYLCRMKTVKPGKGDFRLHASLCTRMLTLGITSFLSQISLVAAMAAINNMLRKYGALDEIFSQEQYAQIPMAVVGIVMKSFQIVISIVVGMAAGCIPVVGYNMGAGKKTRVRELFTKLLLCEAIVGAVALVLAEGFPRQLIAVFGAANESSYYTDFARMTPPDTLILTLACGKYRLNDMDLGSIEGIPRVLDCGQCNDAYSAIRIALALAEAFGCGVNDLPLTLVLSWYEQKAVCILLTLLYLGLRNIYLGPTLPAFVSPNVLDFLVKQYNLTPTGDPKTDLEKILNRQ